MSMNGTVQLAQRNFGPNPASEALSEQEIHYINNRLAEEFVDRLGYEATPSNLELMVNLINEFEKTQ